MAKSEQAGALLAVLSSKDYLGHAWSGHTEVAELDEKGAAVVGADGKAKTKMVLRYVAWVPNFPKARQLFAGGVRSFTMDTSFNVNNFGMLMTDIVARDENNSIVPVMFMLHLFKDAATYETLLRAWNSGSASRSVPLSFVRADSDPAIALAVRSALPGVALVLCFYHILLNLSTRRGRLDEVNALEGDGAAGASAAPPPPPPVAATSSSSSTTTAAATTSRVPQGPSALQARVDALRVRLKSRAAAEDAFRTADDDVLGALLNECESSADELLPFGWVAATVPDGKPTDIFFYDVVTKTHQTWNIPTSASVFMLKRLRAR